MTFMQPEASSANIVLEIILDCIELGADPIYHTSSNFKPR